jgi:hypothetical protein
MKMGLSPGLLPYRTPPARVPPINQSSGLWVGIPIDLPDEMSYDSYNRLTEYIATEDRKVRLLYDPMGRVFRKEACSWISKEWELSKAVHYYYHGSRLMQKYDVTAVSETEAQA